MSARSSIRHGMLAALLLALSHGLPEIPGGQALGAVWRGRGRGRGW